MYFFLQFQYVFVRLAKEFERNCRGAEAAFHLSLQKVSFTQWNGGLKGHLSIWKEPICNCKSCIYFLTPTKSHFQAFNLEPVGIFYLLIFHSFVEQTKSLMQNFSDACCVLVGLDQTSPNKIRWYSLSRHS